MNAKDLKPGEVLAADAGETTDRPVDKQPIEHTLGDMINDGFKFFTTALIQTHGLFDRDPLVEFRRHRPAITDDKAPFAIDCDYPFFSGLGYGLLNDQFVQWDRRLYGIHADSWPALHQFVSALTMYHRPTYHYAKVGWQMLEIVDPTALRSGRVLAEIPTIQITVFCVSSYRCFAYIAPAVDPPRTLPFLKLDPPNPDLQAEAQALLGPPAGDVDGLAQYKAQQSGQVGS